jgi:hypothetical protein
VASAGDQLRWFVFTTTSLYSSDAAHAKEWRADLIPWSEHNTEAFQGLHNQGKRLCLIFDEASAIQDKVWDVAEGALTDSTTRRSSGSRSGTRRATPAASASVSGSSSTAGGTTRSTRATVEGVNHTQIQKWVDDYGEDSDFVKVRVRGMFPSAAARQFIDESWSTRPTAKRSIRATSRTRRRS